MKVLEFGSPENAAVLLVHGMACDGMRSFATSVARLKSKYYILVPLMDGHDGADAPFSSIAEQAEKIAGYLKEHHIQRLHAALGMSMGGFVCIELFSKFEVSTDTLILDSGYMPNLPFPKVIAAVVSAGFCALLRGSKAKIIPFAMKRMMGYSFRGEDLFPASKQTVYNSEYSCLTYRLPDTIQRINAKHVAYWYGQKERYMIRGMEILKELIPSMQTECMGSVGHGEVMFESPEQYGDKVFAALS
jgi:pimeloyl-ACP methyl ester carboxylesterase